MAHCPTIVFEIPGWAEKHAGKVHELAEGEIGKQYTDQKHMNEENGADFGAYGRRQGNPSDSEVFDIDDINVGSQYVAHENTGYRDGKD